MRSHVCLLSGINLGKVNTLAMSDLRDIVAELGFGDVATYIRSGNVVFSCPGGTPAELATKLDEAIASRSDVRTRVVVVSRPELAAIVSSNPYPQEDDPKRLHVVFHREPITPEAIAAVQEAGQRAAAKGSRDEVTVRGKCLFLHTPDGLGRSVLAAELARPRLHATKDSVHTMRNWATVTRLLEMLTRDPH